MMCEQKEKQKDDQHLDSVVNDYCASLLSFEPEQQNYILMRLRDLLYNKRLHEIEDLEVRLANQQQHLKTLKSCNGEIGYSKL